MPVEIEQTDSRDVMEMSVSLWITEQIWEQVSRAIHSDDSERVLLEVYGRVFRSVHQTHAQS